MTKFSTKKGKFIKSALVRAGFSGRTKLIDCPGEAHRNAFIDNCMLCAPRWGKIEVPIECADLNAWRDIVSDAV